MPTKLVFRTLDDLLDAIGRKRKCSIFIGAGISRAAGIPLGSEIVNSLAKELSEKNNLDIKEGKNVEEWLTKQPFYDPENKYGSTLDATFPNKEERARYFATLIEGKTPSAAHMSIAKLMDQDMVTAVLTTNFDRLMEYASLQACGKFPITLLFDKNPLYVNMNSRRPKVMKLHGDYLYGNIRNLGYELLSIKQSMSRKIGIVKGEGPLIVAGYSGGDNSVMDVLDELSKNQSAFPCGIFWLTLRNCVPNRRVLNVLAQTQDRGSGLIEIDDCDSFFSHLADKLSVEEVDGPRIKSGSHLVPIDEERRQSYVADRLDDVSATELLLLMQRSPLVREFATSEASIDYLVARYEEDIEITTNMGELLDRYVDLVANSGYFMSQNPCIDNAGNAIVDKKIGALVKIGLLDKEEGCIEKIRKPLLRSYVQALQMKECTVSPEEIGKMLQDRNDYRTLCLFIGLIENATYVIKSAVHRSVDSIVLYGRTKPWPESFYKAAKLIGCSERVDRAYVERIADMLLVEFDVERWFPHGAIDALASVGNSVIDQLIQYMLDPLQETYSREDAALSLGRIGNRRVVDRLREAAQGLSPRNLKMVVYALGQTGNPRAIPVLRELASNMSSVSENVLDTALENVGYSGKDISASPIEEDPSPRIELDRQEVLERYVPKLDSPQCALIFQEQFRQNPSATLEVMASLGWPPEAKDLSSAGTSLLSQNRPWEAEVALAECLDRYPMLFWSYHNLALAYSRQGRPFAARRYYALGLSLKPDYVDYYNDFAVTMLKLGNLEAVRHLLVKAISIDSNSYRPWLNLAHLNIQESGGVRREGSEEFGSKPGLYVGSYSFGLETIVDPGKLKEAIVCLQKVISLNSAHPTAALSLNQLLMLTGERENAEPEPSKIFQVLHVGETIIPKATRLEDLPKNAVDEWKLSSELKLKGDFQGALKAMKHVWEIYPKSPDIAHNIALLLASIGNLNEALDFLENALEKWPWDYHLLLNYACYLTEANRYGDAIRAAEKAVMVNSDDGASWYQLAKSYREGKNFNKSAEATREAIRRSTPWSHLESVAEDLLQKVAQ